MIKYRHLQCVRRFDGSAACFLGISNFRIEEAGSRDVIQSAVLTVNGLD